MGQGSGWEGMVLMLCLSLPAGELDLAVQDGERRVRTRRSLPEGFSWGPFQGSAGSSHPGHVLPPPHPLRVAHGQLQPRIFEARESRPGSIPTSSSSSSSLPRFFLLFFLAQARLSLPN
uniref:Zinc finger protein ZFPM1/2 PR domain-containing protein n=1 Tax=Buteo japonicus TaxID=224669 RepID=A0A8B9Z1H6_9AVES